MRDTTIPFDVTITSMSRIDIDCMELRGTAAIPWRGLIEIVPCVVLVQHVDGEMRAVSMTLNPDDGDPVDATSLTW